MHLRGNSTGNGAGCPTFFLLSPLKFHTGVDAGSLSPSNSQKPLVQLMKSSRDMSEIRLPLVFFHVVLYITRITSTGEITKGAEALSHEPQAVLLEMFCSFQMIVV